jgi:hypothetical protein
VDGNVNYKTHSENDLGVKGTEASRWRTRDRMKTGGDRERERERERKRCKE